MALVLLLGGLGLLALPGAARRLGSPLVPAEWARLSAGLLLGGAAVVWLSTVLFAAPTVLRALGVPHLAEACERMLGPLTPGGPAVGVVGSRRRCRPPGLQRGGVRPGPARSAPPSYRALARAARAVRRS